jgi:hypothetical protein
MIVKGDIPSIQYKVILRGPKSVKKVDGLSLIFIDFYVPALIPHLNGTETSLQLSEYITLFAVCCIYTGKETKIDTRCLGHINYTGYPRSLVPYFRSVLRVPYRTLK